MTDIGRFPASVRVSLSFWKGLFPDGYFMLSEQKPLAQKVRLGLRRVEDWIKVDVRDTPPQAVLLSMVVAGEIASAEPDAFLDEDGGRWLYWKLLPDAFAALEKPREKPCRKAGRRRG